MYAIYPTGWRLIPDKASVYQFKITTIPMVGTHVSHIHMSMTPTMATPLIAELPRLLFFSICKSTGLKHCTC